MRWAGDSGLFCALAGTEIEATVLKHKRAAPGKRARVTCTTFEAAGAPLVACAKARLRLPTMRGIVRQNSRCDEGIRSSRPVGASRECASIGRRSFASTNRRICRS